MKAIEYFRKRLALVGATLDDTAYNLHCDAPDGYVWRANDLPSFSVHYATNSQSWLTEAIQRELPALKMGLRKVTDEAELKEHQWNLGDDNWKAPDDAPDFIPFK